MKAKLITVTFLILITMLGCINRESRVVKYLLDLKDVESVSIYVNGQVVHEIEESNKIEYFLNTFKPTQNSKLDNISPTSFSQDGKIEFLSKKSGKVIITLDTDLGYSLKIDGKEYFERFTYQTGRYILEVM